MRRTITFLLLAATAAGPLAAQAWNPQDQRQQRGDDRGNRDAARADQRRADPRAVETDGRDDARIARREDQRRDGGDDRRGDGRYDNRGGRQDGRGQDRYDGRGDYRYDERGNRPGYARGPGNGGIYRDDRGRNDGRGGWNSQWRGDRRYDWQGYRSSNRALYRAPRYYGPRGSDYSRWSRGYRIQPYYYGRNYWISDPYRYRLPPAYGDYRWVRYYDDVALVDIRTGLIEDIIHSFFYR